MAQPQTHAQAQAQQAAPRPNAILGALRHDTAFADAVLVVGDMETPVHRAVLSQLSPFFKTIFQQCAKNGASGVPRITLQHASRASVAVLVDYAYGLDATAQCRTSLDTALDVANLAATLGISQLCALATNAALYLVRAPEYSRVYYALRLFGREDDARTLISLAARDPGFWVANGALERFSAADVELLLKSPDVVASEDTLLKALASWLTVDPATREKVFRERFFTTIKAQRLTGSSADAMRTVQRYLPQHIVTEMLIASASRAIVPPVGAELGAIGSVARARGGSNAMPMIAAPLDWLTPVGRNAFSSREFRVYPVQLVCSQQLVIPIHNLTIDSLREGINRWFYFDFVSLCLRFQVSLSETSFIAEPTIERRNRADIADPNARAPTLASALEPLAVIIETALSFVPGTPLQNAFSVWRGVDLAPMAQAQLRSSTPTNSPVVKRRRTAVIARRIELADKQRRLAVVEAVKKGDVDAINIVLCLRTAKMSQLRSQGFLAPDEPVPPPPAHAAPLLLS